MAYRDLPMDIIIEILQRTRAKSLLRFKCLSKTFYALISSSAFINRHLLHSRSSDKNQFLISLENDNGIYSLDIDSPEHRSDSVQLGPVRLNGSYCFVVGSCNGLVCIKIILYSGEHRDVLAVFNPCTEKHQIIHCRSSTCSYSFGFGYDSLADDYKIVAIPKHGRRMMVFSLRESKWRFVETPYHDLEGELWVRDTGALVDDHLLHWKFWFPSEKKHRIRCFNVREEKWVGEVPLPNYASKGSGAMKTDLISLGNVNGCLCLVTVGNSANMADVWVMREYGNKDSWLKLSSISYKGKTAIVVPLAYRQGCSGSQILLMMQSGSKSSELVWSNTRDKTGLAETIFTKVTLVGAYEESLIKLPYCEYGK